MSKKHLKSIASLSQAFGLTVRSETVVPIDGYCDIIYSFRDAADQQYFTKIYTQEKPEVVVSLASAVNFLESKDVPIIPFLPTLEGEIYYLHDNMAGVLQSFCHAPLIGDSAISSELAFETGAVLGKIHSLSKAYPEELDHPYQPSPSWNPDNFDMTLHGFQIVKARLDRDLAEIIEALGERWQKDKGGLAQCARGFIHSDFNASNIMVRGNKIEAVIDFSDATMSWFASDIGTALMYLFAQDKMSWPQMSDFMRGYRTNCDLSAEEEALLPYCISQRAAVSLLGNLQDKNHIPPATAQVLRDMAKPENVAQIQHYIAA